MSLISPQRTFGDDQFLQDISSYDGNILTSVLPDFKSLIPPAQLRRLSRMLRMGLTTSMRCLRDAQLASADGIITATGYGFLEETEKFLREIIDRNEKQLTPTFFMQGTYNALAGLVALSLKCTGYNNTYVSKGFAFENALDDATLQLNHHPDGNFLIGAFDEAAQVQHLTGLRAGYFKKEPINSLQLFQSNTEGTIQGEGCAFFCLSGKATDTTSCELVDVHTLYKPTQDELHETLTGFLQRKHLSIRDIDIWINGMSGDPARDGLMDLLQQSIMKDIPQARYKHLSGEYCTASSFGLWLGARMIRLQHIPEAVRFNTTAYPASVNYVLAINHYLDSNYTLMLLKKPANG